MAKRKVKKVQRTKGKCSRKPSNKGKHSKVHKLIKLARAGIKKHVTKHVVKHAKKARPVTKKTKKRVIIKKNKKRTVIKKKKKKRR